MRIESDIEKALGSEDSEPSVSSEYGVVSPHLLERFSAGSLPGELPRPGLRSVQPNWAIIVTAFGLALSLLAAAVLAFGGAILSAMAFLFG